MPPQSLVALITSIVVTTAPTMAADLARHSPLGEVFAERPARAIVREEEPPPREVFLMPVKVPGYYGGYDTTYRNYYGTSPVTIFTRLPYACRWHGIC